MNFLEINLSFTLELLENWLQVDDLGQLDSAFCNMEDRSVFLYQLGTISTYGLEKKPVSKSYLAWLRLRGIKTLGLVILNNPDIFKQFDLDFLSELIKLTIEPFEKENRFEFNFSRFLKKLPSIKKITLTRCESPATIKLIADNCPGLIHVGLTSHEQNKTITDLEIKYLIKSLPRLITFHIDGYSNVSPIIFDTLLKYCRNFTTLFLHYDEHDQESNTVMSDMAPSTLAFIAYHKIQQYWSTSHCENEKIRFYLEKINPNPGINNRITFALSGMPGNSPWYTQCFNLLLEDRTDLSHLHTIHSSFNDCTSEQIQKLIKKTPNLTKYLTYNGDFYWLFVILEAISLNCKSFRTLYIQSSQFWLQHVLQTLLMFANFPSFTLIVSCYTTLGVELPRPFLYAKLGPGEYCYRPLDTYVNTAEFRSHEKQFNIECNKDIVSRKDADEDWHFTLQPTPNVYVEDGVVVVKSGRRPRAKKTASDIKNNDNNMDNNKDNSSNNSSNNNSNKNSNNLNNSNNSSGANNSILTTDKKIFKTWLEYASLPHPLPTCEKGPGYLHSKIKYLMSSALENYLDKSWKSRFKESHIIRSMKAYQAEIKKMKKIDEQRALQRQNSNLQQVLPPPQQPAAEQPVVLDTPQALPLLPVVEPTSQEPDEAQPLAPTQSAQSSQLTQSAVAQPEQAQQTQAQQQQPKDKSLQKESLPLLPPPVTAVSTAVTSDQPSVNTDNTAATATTTVIATITAVTACATTTAAHPLVTTAAPRKEQEEVFTTVEDISVDLIDDFIEEKRSSEHVVPTQSLSQVSTTSAEQVLSGEQLKEQEKKEKKELTTSEFIFETFLSDLSDAEREEQEEAAQQLTLLHQLTPLPQTVIYPMAMSPQVLADAPVIQTQQPLYHHHPPQPALPQQHQMYQQQPYHPQHQAHFMYQQPPQPVMRILPQQNESDKMNETFLSDVIAAENQEQRQLTSPSLELLPLYTLQLPKDRPENVFYTEDDATKIDVETDENDLQAERDSEQYDQQVPLSSEEQAVVLEYQQQTVFTTHFVPIDVNNGSEGSGDSSAYNQQQQLQSTYQSMSASRFVLLPQKSNMYDDPHYNSSKKQKNLGWTSRTNSRNNSRNSSRSNSVISFVGDAGDEIVHLPPKPPTPARLPMSAPNSPVPRSKRPYYNFTPNTPIPPDNSRYGGSPAVRSSPAVGDDLLDTNGLKRLRTQFAYGSSEMPVLTTGRDEIVTLQPRDNWLHSPIHTSPEAYLEHCKKQFRNSINSTSVISSAEQKAKCKAIEKAIKKEFGIGKKTRKNAKNNSQTNSRSATPVHGGVRLVAKSADSQMNKKSEFLTASLFGADDSDSENETKLHDNNNSINNSSYNNHNNNSNNNYNSNYNNNSNNNDDDNVYEIIPMAPPIRSPLGSQFSSPLTSPMASPLSTPKKAKRAYVRRSVISSPFPPQSQG